MAGNRINVATVLEQIRSVDEAVTGNIEALAGNRSLLSQNLIAQLRNLVECVAVRLQTGSDDAHFDYSDVGTALAHIRANAKLNFLGRFHKLIQISASHYTVDGDSSERLMLKYYAYLVRLRALLLDNCGIEVLGNLEAFPVDLDPSLREYYEKIAARIDAVRGTPADVSDDRPPLKWTAQEYSPRHRWWWCLIVGVVGLYLTSFLYLDDQWGAAALAFVVTFALIVFAADKPRSWHYELEGRTLAVEGKTRVKLIFIKWDLRDFKAVTREEIVRRRGAPPFELLVLIGKRPFSWPRDVYLTGNIASDKRILERLSEAVPIDPDHSFRAATKKSQ